MQRCGFLNPVYKGSYATDYINNWFNGTATGQYQDKLASNARLRDFTMQNTAINTPGTATSVGSFSNGYSKPTKYKSGIGNDVAFLLSYSEAANFVSNNAYYRQQPITFESCAEAKANYAKISIPPQSQLSGYSFAWLRSVGDSDSTNYKTMGSLEGPPTLGNTIGRVFQFQTTTYGFIYPALWVDQAIFTPVQTPAQQAINNASINSTVNIDGYDWYVARKVTTGGANYAMLVAKNPMRQEVSFSVNAANTNYEGSNLQNVVTQIYLSLNDIRTIAVVPDLGTLSSLTSTTEPTAAMAGSQTKNIMFALSYRDVYNWNGGKETPLISPLTNYTMRWLTRSPSTATTVYEIMPANLSAPGYLTGGLNALGYNGETVVPGIWVKIG